MNISLISRSNVLSNNVFKGLIISAVLLIGSGFFIFNVQNVFANHNQPPSDTWDVDNTEYANDDDCVALRHCNTIQAAIDAADPGDTINVAEGTYGDDLTVDKELTLNGGVDLGDGEGPSVIDTATVLVTADNVTLNNFTFTGDNEGAAFINLDNDVAHSGINITNNLFDGAITTWHVIRAGGNKDDLTITGNTFTDSTSGNDNALILLSVGGSNINVSDNVFESFPSDYSLVAIQHAANLGDRTEGLTINNNQFDYTGYTNDGNGSEAISVRYADDVTVSGNTLTGSATDEVYEAGITIASVTSEDGQSVISGNSVNGFSRGIRIQRWAENDGNSDNIEITNNMVTDGVTNDENYGAESTGVGLFLAGVTNLSADGNTITGHANAGVFVPATVSDGADNEISDMVLSDNTITGNEKGVDNFTETGIDARDNWWGSANGPEHSSNTFNVEDQGNSASDNVNFVPWLDAAPLVGESFAPVTTNDPEGSDYSSIQAAVDAVGESFTVTAKAGTYTESGIEATTEGISILGEEGAIVRTPDGCPSSEPSAVFHLHADNITLSGFEIDADDECDNAVHVGDLSEVTVAGVTVSDNEVYGATYGVTLSWGSSDDGENQNVVSDNNIHDNDTGVLIDSAHWNSVEDNNIHDNSNNGILIENCIQDFDGCPGGVPSNNTITGNTIADNGDGEDTGIEIEALGEGNSANFNSITGNGFGVNNDTEVTFNAANNWWGNVSGPFHAVDNPTGSGDEVSDNVTFDPWSTDTFPPLIGGDVTAGSSNATGFTVTWTTITPATSRVIYDTVSHPVLGGAPNYGYPNSTVETDTDPKVTEHSVTLTGLTANTTYYYRTVSHGSPESVGGENSFGTSLTESPPASTGGGGGGGGATTTPLALAAQTGQTGQTGQVAGAAIAGCRNYGTDLRLGSRSDESSSLQDFLVAKNSGPAAVALAQAFAGGVPKGYFGSLTRSAVAEFQAANSITPAAGYFGSKTRTFVNSVCAGQVQGTSTSANQELLRSLQAQLLTLLQKLAEALQAQLK